jgi:hypothetical protein
MFFQTGGRQQGREGHIGTVVVEAVVVSQIIYPETIGYF